MSQPRIFHNHHGLPQGIFISFFYNEFCNSSVHDLILDTQMCKHQTCAPTKSLCRNPISCLSKISTFFSPHVMTLWRAGSLVDGWETRSVAPTGSPFHREYIYIYIEDIGNICWEYLLGIWVPQVRCFYRSLSSPLESHISIGF